MKKINETLYSIRFIACLLIILIHASFPGALGAIGTYTARFAVPFFFMVSGYFGYQVTREKLKQRRSRIAALCAKAFIGYFLLYMVIGWYNHMLPELWQSVSEPQNILLFLFCNWTTPLVGVGHLWYLFAIWYVYFIVPHIMTERAWHFTYIFAVVALLLAYGFQIFNHFGHLHWLNIYWRNFLFEGLSMYAIGHYLHKLKLEKKVTKEFLFGIGGGTAVLYVLEGFLNRGGGFELYLSSIGISITLFLYALLYPNISTLARIGKKYTTDIYIMLYAAIVVFTKIFHLQEHILARCLWPIIIFLATISVIFLWNKFTIKIRHE